MPYAPPPQYNGTSLNRVSVRGRCLGAFIVYYVYLIINAGDWLIIGTRRLAATGSKRHTTKPSPSARLFPHQVYNGVSSADILQVVLTATKTDRLLYYHRQKRKRDGFDVIFPVQNLVTTSTTLDPESRLSLSARKRPQELGLFFRRLEATMTILGTGVDELKVHFFQGRALGVDQQRLAKSKRALLGPNKASLRQRKTRKRENE